MGDYTTEYNLYKPDITASEKGWGSKVNDNCDIIEAKFNAIDADRIVIEDHFSQVELDNLNSERYVVKNILSLIFNTALNDAENISTVYDGFVDTFKDDTTIDDGNSINFVYDADTDTWNTETNVNDPTYNPYYDTHRYYVGFLRSNPVWVPMEPELLRILVKMNITSQEALNDALRMEVSIDGGSFWESVNLTPVTDETITGFHAVKPITLQPQHEQDLHVDPAYCRWTDDYFNETHTNCNPPDIFALPIYEYGYAGGAFGYTYYYHFFCNTRHARVNIDFGRAFHAEKIFMVNPYDDNAENTATLENTGVKNFEIWGTNDPTAFEQTGYQDMTGWTQLITYSDEARTVVDSALILQTGSYIGEPAVLTPDTQIRYLSHDNDSYQYYAFVALDNFITDTEDPYYNMTLFKGIMFYERSEESVYSAEVDVSELTASSADHDFGADIVYKFENDIDVGMNIDKVGMICQ